MFTSTFIIIQQLTKQSGNKGIIGGANSKSISIINALDSFYTEGTNNINDTTIFCTTMKSNTSSIVSLLSRVQSKAEDN